jgi:hypothetical protein
MENRTTKLMKVEPVMMIMYDLQDKRFIGSLEVGRECIGFEAVKNVVVYDDTRLKVFAQLDEAIGALKRVLFYEKEVKTRKPRIMTAA